jgi:hypothetical protein
MRASLVCLLVLASGLSASAATGQATTRSCGPAEESGPACLLARQEISRLPDLKVYWHIDRFPSSDLAGKAGIPTSTVVEAFKASWLFTLAGASWRPRGGERVAEIGPLPVALAPRYQAEYLRSIFVPGSTAPLHVHSGPEAFYAVDGDTCLETPDGMQIGRGPGNRLMIKAGPPMLLMAIGSVPRRGFALILHDASAPPTTLTQAWHPNGLCARQLSEDQAQATATK